VAPGVTEGASVIGAVTSVSTVEVRSPADGRIVGGFELPLPMNGWQDPGIGSRSGGAPGMLDSCSAAVRRLRAYPPGRRAAPVQQRAEDAIEEGLRIAEAHGGEALSARPSGPSKSATSPSSSSARFEAE
jgi:hypothetical protein